MRGEPETGGGSLLTRHQDTELSFQLELWRGAPSYNSGRLEGTITVKDDTAVFRGDPAFGDCRLRFTFSERKVDIQYVDEAYHCGFGHGVYANGSYPRTSREPPTFLDPNP